MRAARDERDLSPAVCQRRSDKSADCTSTNDSKMHSSLFTQNGEEPRRARSRTPKRTAKAPPSRVRAAYAQEELIVKVGILGSGAVAQSLGAGFALHGHSVMLGTRDTARLLEWQQQHPGTALGAVAEAAAFGELLVLAVKGLAAAVPLRAAGEANLRGKTVIDTTNPTADAPPINGVLQFFTFRQSLQLGGQHAVCESAVCRRPANDVHLRERR
jgi:hypothetical protein